MSFTSQLFESFVPVYDQVPTEWRDARPFLVEQLKQIANATNIREIGWYITTPILTGKPFEPSILPNAPQEYRQIFRLLINIGPVVATVMKSVPTGIIFDINFTLVQMWASATDSINFNAVTITGNNVTMNVVAGISYINVTSPITADRCFAVIEYLLEP